MNPLTAPNTANVRFKRLCINLRRLRFLLNRTKDADSQYPTAKIDNILGKQCYQQSDKGQ